MNNLNNVRPISSRSKRRHVTPMLARTIDLTRARLLESSFDSGVVDESASGRRNRDEVRCSANFLFTWRVFRYRRSAVGNAAGTRVSVRTACQAVENCGHTRCFPAFRHPSGRLHLDVPCADATLARPPPSRSHDDTLARAPVFG